MTQSTNKITNLMNLFALLEGTEEVAWRKVTCLLAGYPGWTHLVYMIRFRPHDTEFAEESDPQSEYVSKSMRQRLLALFRPYVLLLNNQRSPLECMALLESEAEVDAVLFCKECRYNASPEIAAAAQSILDAANHQQTLLRNAFPPIGPRSIHAADMPEQKKGWFRRLFKRE
jgi:hypothetical protein